MLQISNKVTIPDAEIEMHAIRSQGAGGQNVKLFRGIKVNSCLTVIMVLKGKVG